MSTQPSLKRLIRFAKQMRKHASDSDKLLWRCLRNRRFIAYKFRRQHPIQGYILDFYCHELRLGIEIDGDYHYQTRQNFYDEARDENLLQRHVQVLRYTSYDVLTNLTGVLTHLWQFARQKR